MEPRHEDALRRIYQADKALRDMGNEPASFHHYYEVGSGPIFEHPCWDSSWATPSEETIDDLAELGLLRIEQPRGGGTSFSLSMKGRDEAARLVERGKAPIEASKTSPAPPVSRDPKKVAVMHGRDLEAKRWIYDWLRRVGLEPLEWGQLVELTGKATPYNGEAVEVAFSTAQAVVVLLTPDELGGLHPDLIEADGQRDEEGVAGQARLNVILEAGMAFQSHPGETILVEIGTTREISDLAGRNTVRLTGDRGGVNALASRLEVAGCTVNRTGNDWLDTTDLVRLGALRRRATALGSCGGVAATGVEGDRYRAFRVGDRRVEGRAHDGSKWSDWSEVGVLEEEAVGLAAASAGPGQVEVFALLANGEVVRNWRRRDDEWKDRFQPLGRPFGSDPAIRITAAVKGHGHQEVFVEAADGSIAHIWWEGRWHFNDDPATRLNDGWWLF